MVDPDTVTVGDFVESHAEGPLRRGVYRVVGTPGDALVCLRVTDDRGKRTATGDLARIDRADASALALASEPRPTLRGLLRNLVQGPYWTVRSFL